MKTRQQPGAPRAAKIPISFAPSDGVTGAALGATESRWFEHNGHAADPLILRLVADELRRARSLHPQPFVDAHHALGILAEEVREFEMEVFKRRPNRKRMEAELLQIAAVALRAIEDLATAKGAKSRQD